MSKLYKITIKKNYVVCTTSEWNGRDSDALHGTVEVEREIQDGWYVNALELDAGFTSEETYFEEAYTKIINAKNKSDLFAGCEIEVNFPRESRKHFTDTNTKTISSKGIVLYDDDFDFTEETLFAFVRVGMSTNRSYAKEAWLVAPIKENKKGKSIRGYAAYMELDQELEEDKEFYNYIMEKLNL